MLDIHTPIEFIANLPRYNEEKPFFVFPSDLTEYTADDSDLSNVEWETHEVTVRSIRGREVDLGLSKSGFEVVEHTSQIIPVDTPEAVSRYREETKVFLKDFFAADEVICYDFKRRKNTDLHVEVFDPGNRMLVESIARGAHDVSLDAVPEAIRKLLSMNLYRTLYPDNPRLTSLNSTWRSLLPEVDDSPLAVCDFRTVDANDLLATDRVYPTWLQETYYLKYNQSQQWYWMPKQKSSEPFLMLMYDSHAGENARYCPHIGIPNPTAKQGAPPRESAETRSLVITRR